MATTARRRLSIDLSILAFGQVVASTAILAIKLSSLHPALLGALRLLVAAAVLTPLYCRDSRLEGRRFRSMAAEALPSVLPGIFLAAHFITWNYGAQLTLAANASLIVNMSPAAMPFVMYFLRRDQPRRRELLGTVVALSGVLVLSGAKVRLGSETLAGDLICFGSMVLLTCYMALGRTNNRQSSLWLYVVPLYWIAGIGALGFSAVLILRDGLWRGPAPASAAAMAKELLYPLYLGLLPTVVGHSIINRSMKVLSSQIVSIAMLSQFIFAGVFSFLLFAEFPAPQFFPAALLVIAGAAVIILDRH